MKRYKNFQTIKSEIEKIIWRTDDEIIYFKPTEIERAGFLPRVLKDGKWKLKTHTEEWKLQPMKSDNIDWICRLDVIRIKI